MSFKIASFILLLTTLSLPAIAQTQYMVRLNIADGSFTKLKKLTGVSATVPGQAVYDAKRSQYIFSVIKGSSQQTLYSVNTGDYQIVHSPEFNYERYGQALSGFACNPADSMTYALHHDNANKKSYIARIDAPTGISTDMTDLPDLAIATPYAAIDAGRQQYIFLGTDSNNVTRIYSFCLKNLKIISAPALSDSSASFTSASELIYDEQMDKLFSFCYSKERKIMSLVSVDRETGSVTSIKNIEGIQFIAPYRTVYDAGRHHITFNGIGDNSLLLTIDATNGNIVYRCNFPTLQPQDNIEAPVYDSSSDAFYALYWEPHNTHVGDNPASMVEIYPNPFSNRTTIGLGQNYATVNLTLYNTTGRPVMYKSLKNASDIYLEVDRNFISAGTYFATIATDGKPFRVIKLVVGG